MTVDVATCTLHPLLRPHHHYQCLGSTTPSPGQAADAVEKDVSNVTRSIQPVLVQPSSVAQAQTDAYPTYQGSCSRHRVKCYYDRSLNPSFGPRPEPAEQSTASSSAERQPADLLTLEGRGRRLMELGLLHIFTTEVCASFPGTANFEAINNVWSAEVPRLALTYDPLLNAIFAISILYINSTGYDGLQLTDDIATLRARYLEATLHEHRQAISNMDKGIAEAASFASVLLSFDAFANMRERQLEPYQPPIQWLQLCKGVMNVFRIAADFVRQDPNSVVNMTMETSASWAEPSVIFCEANRSRFPYLLERRGDETESDLDHEAYMDTLCYIGAAMTALESGENVGIVSRKLIVFPILFPSRFIELLGQYKPRALVILAHYFAAASQCGHSWLISDTPAREIDAIAAHMGPDWQGAMDWPLKTIQQDGPSTATEMDSQP